MAGWPKQEPDLRKRGAPVSAQVIEDRISMYINAMDKASNFSDDHHKTQLERDIQRLVDLMEKLHSGVDVLDVELPPPLDITPQTDVLVNPLGELSSRLADYHKALYFAEEELSDGRLNKIQNLQRALHTMQGLQKRAQAGIPVRADEIPPPVTIPSDDEFDPQAENTIAERLTQYQAALEAAKSGHVKSLVLKLERGIRSLEFLMTRAKARRPVWKKDIPPDPRVEAEGRKEKNTQVKGKQTIQIRSLILRLSKCSFTQPDNQQQLKDMLQRLKTIEQSVKDGDKDTAKLDLDSLTNMVKAMEKLAEKESLKATSTNATQNTEDLELVNQRLKEYTDAAIQAKKEQRLNHALQHFKIVKCLKPIKEALEKGEVVDMSLVPPPPRLFTPVSETAPSISTQNGEDSEHIDTGFSQQNSLSNLPHITTPNSIDNQLLLPKVVNSTNSFPSSKPSQTGKKLNLNNIGVVSCDNRETVDSAVSRFGLQTDSSRDRMAPNQMSNPTEALENGSSDVLNSVDGVVTDNTEFNKSSALNNQLISVLTKTPSFEDVPKSSFETQNTHSLLTISNTESDKGLSKDSLPNKTVSCNNEEVSTEKANEESGSIAHINKNIENNVSNYNTDENQTILNSANSIETTGVHNDSQEDCIESEINENDTSLNHREVESNLATQDKKDDHLEFEDLMNSMSFQSTEHSFAAKNNLVNEENTSTQSALTLENTTIAHSSITTLQSEPNQERLSSPIVQLSLDSKSEYTSSSTGVLNTSAKQEVDQSLPPKEEKQNVYSGNENTSLPDNSIINKKLDEKNPETQNNRSEGANSMKNTVNGVSTLNENHETEPVELPVLVSTDKDVQENGSEEREEFPSLPSPGMALKIAQQPKQTSFKFTCLENLKYDMLLSEIQDGKSNSEVEKLKTWIDNIKERLKVEGRATWDVYKLSVEADLRTLSQQMSLALKDQDWKKMKYLSEKKNLAERELAILRERIPELKY